MPLGASVSRLSPLHLSSMWRDRLSSVGSGSEAAASRASDENLMMVTSGGLDDQGASGVDISGTGTGTTGTGTGTGTGTAIGPSTSLSELVNMRDGAGWIITGVAMGTGNQTSNTNTTTGGGSGSSGSSGGMSGGLASSVSGVIGSGSGSGSGGGGGAEEKVCLRVVQMMGGEKQEHRIVFGSAAERDEWVKKLAELKVEQFGATPPRALPPFPF